MKQYCTLFFLFLSLFSSCTGKQIQERVDQAFEELAEEIDKHLVSTAEMERADKTFDDLAKEIEDFVKNNDMTEKMEK